ncbi:Ethanolamine ammonia-lyase [Leptothrix cholodnii SP-6]|uniref:Ethanolamine ammonia-lyase small subunit n=1 Tax=Leptothrix cholodnii (strain ATCC 51168 / LMG 8142 / SP-6) TaxID=395495 RepID=B1XXE7_LEPCP|nr:ethanolamine ammonia-lyase subunit EutC [Leptothrix cholodnii]ACB35067.1 Ethanolamine ammonia-lyase [Leptothrix cholodnii SP-6]
MTPPVTPARWDTLRRYTDARIALGRAGHSLPTAAHLAFQLAHAQARDAVHLPFDVRGVSAALQALGLESLSLHSAAIDRAVYLQRPDLGRRLDEPSRQALAQWRAGQSGRFDLAFVIADGLSALAVHQNAVALISATLARLRSDPVQTWSVAPIALVEEGRVAIGDEAGHGLRADAVVVLIGERPGLSSPDSLGIYITWAPGPGLTDASRNCISNVRPAGLSIDAAATRLHRLLAQARLRQLTGVALKDDVDEQPSALAPGQPKGDESDSFLLAPTGPGRPGSQPD